MDIEIHSIGHHQSAAPQTRQPYQHPPKRQRMAQAHAAVDYSEYDQIWDQLRQMQLIFKNHNQNISNFETQLVKDIEDEEKFLLELVYKRKHALLHTVASEFQLHREQMGAVTAQFWQLRQRMKLFLDKIQQLKQLDPTPAVLQQIRQTYVAAALSYHENSGTLSSDLSELLNTSLSTLQCVCERKALSSHLDRSFKVKDPSTTSDDKPQSQCEDTTQQSSTRVRESPPAPRQCVSGSDREMEARDPHSSPRQFITHRPRHFDDERNFNKTDDRKFDEWNQFDDESFALEPMPPSCDIDMESSPRKRRRSRDRGNGGGRRVRRNRNNGGGRNHRVSGRRTRKRRKRNSHRESDSGDGGRNFKEQESESAKEELPMQRQREAEEEMRNRSTAKSRWMAKSVTTSPTPNKDCDDFKAPPESAPSH